MKQILRQNIIKSRNQLNDKEWLQKSNKIANNLLTLPIMHHSKNIMAFMDFRKEVDMTKILQFILTHDKNHVENTNYFNQFYAFIIDWFLMTFYNKNYAIT